MSVKCGKSWIGATHQELRDPFVCRVSLLEGRRRVEFCRERKACASRSDKWPRTELKSLQRKSGQAPTKFDQKAEHEKMDRAGIERVPGATQQLSKQRGQPKPGKRGRRPTRRATFIFWRAHRKQLGLRTDIVRIHHDVASAKKGDAFCVVGWCSRPEDALTMRVEDKRGST